MKIFLANPRGFCAGVKRAISMVESALKIYGAPIYVRHEIVHNRYVVENFRQRGVIFIEDIAQVPDHAILIFSAHGVTQKVRQQAMCRNLNMIFDATCPLVSKVHREVIQASRNNMEIILIGHAGHPEVIGTMGQYNSKDNAIHLIERKEHILNLRIKNEKKLYFTTQTTLSVEETREMIDILRQRFPYIRGPKKQDICYATTNRQQAVRQMIPYVDILLVVGSKNSSNANRLLELAQYHGISAQLIDSINDLQEEWVINCNNIGITAGASAPEILVQEIIKFLRKLGIQKIVEIFETTENIIFPLPKTLL